MTTVAVLDVGKTNVKLTAASRDGKLLETVSLANGPGAPPPYLHVDTRRIDAWLLDELPALVRRHDIGAIVATGHGSAGALVDDDGLVMPMVDYEAEVPEAVTASHVGSVASFRALGSPLMPGAAHMARQLLWLETEWPEAVARARWFLGGPQYWAFRLSGNGASEYTYLAAQSHLWDFDRRAFSNIVRDRGWQHLIPPLAPAWKPVGTIRPRLARDLDLPADIEILCGIHDSTANFYRYQQAGLTDLTLISTGTWIVGLSDGAAPDSGYEQGYVTRNLDVDGRELSGILAMGGREFALIAGRTLDTSVNETAIEKLIANRTMALPSFVEQDGVFPGSAMKGRVTGPEPETPEARHALALLYVSLLTDICLDRLGADGTIVLDGSFAKDPLYPALVSALKPGRKVLFNTDAYGTASGTALLADHPRRTGLAPVTVETARDITIAGLAAYRQTWRERAEANHAN
ncbi:MAG: carbohydrate kinase [Bauldia sp.]|uniref:FGGY-family carbohydrate kinase n=1 Tax=Bauldia sp. TaxID=2575872 RepID=UPI001DCF1B9E|nr:FGGY family carbohydrate kinase [Bauldia sp.]MCB1495624.1 carbohydrate kinase [Bauldia sp.]